jgi:hypothetical protein
MEIFIIKNSMIRTRLERWLKGLKQLDRIAGRILNEDLLAAVAGDDIVTKMPS